MIKLNATHSNWGIETLISNLNIVFKKLVKTFSSSFKNSGWRTHLAGTIGAFFRHFDREQLEEKSCKPEAIFSIPNFLMILWGEFESLIRGMVSGWRFKEFLEVLGYNIVGVE